MTSPTPPVRPANGKPDRGALSPSTKILAASTTLLIGSAVAMAFWRPSLDNNTNPLLDRLLVSAPLPAEALPKETVSPVQAAKSEKLAGESRAMNCRVSHNASTSAPLPSLAGSPALDTGNVKYAQVFPPPILENDPVPRKTEVKKIGKGEVVSGQKFQNVAVKFERIHQVTATPPKTARPTVDFSQRPTGVSTAEMSDALLPYFHAAENLKPLEKSESSRGPENPFETAPSSSETAPLGQLTPLRPLASTAVSLTELKPLQKKATDTP